MSTRELPEGWTETTIEDISVKCAQRVPRDNEEFIYIDIGSIDRELKRIDSPQHITGENAPSRARKSLKTGDVLVSLTRPNLNAVALVDGKYDGQIASTGFEVIRPIMIESRYIFSTVRSRHFIESITGAVQGALYPAAKSSDVQSYMIALPPLAEQKIIADKLDGLLARVESIKTRLENIPEILKKFRQSVLSAAVSGRLNSKHCPMKSIHVGYGWPHDVEGPSHWVEYKLSDIIKIVGGSQPPKSDFRDVCVDGYIRLIQIRDYKSDNHKVFIPRDKAKRFVYKDDVMIGRYGPPIFQILRGLEGAYNVALMKAVPNEEVIRNDYLYWYLQNFNIFNYVESGSDRTAGQSGVNKKHLESYPMLIPSLTEQDEIIKSLEIFFSYAKSIELKAIDALNKVNNLTQSILAKAFRGELTAQWREENFELISGLNSAEALLEKITAEKLAAGTVKKRAKKTSH